MIPEVCLNDIHADGYMDKGKLSYIVWVQWDIVII